MPLRFMKPCKGRVKGYVGEPPILRKAIEKEAARYGVSMNFVKVVALSWALGVSINEDYKTEQKVARIRRKRA